MDRDHAGSLTSSGGAGPAPLTLFFLGLASLAFDLGSALLKGPFARPGMTLGDAIEAVGVYVVAALVLRAAAESGARGGLGAALFAGAAVTYAFGHGIHLAANSIHDWMERAGVGDSIGIAAFWDERAGHYLADAARIAFAVLLTSADARTAAPRSVGAWVLLATGGLAFGFILFAVSVEGETVPMVLPFALVYAVWGAVAARRERARARPSGTARPFFTIAAAAALLLYAVWGFWQGGFPEFTETGFLPSAGAP